MLGYVLVFLAVIAVFIGVIFLGVWVRHEVYLKDKRVG